MLTGSPPENKTEITRDYNSFRRHSSKQLLTNTTKLEHRIAAPLFRCVKIWLVLILWAVICKSRKDQTRLDILLKNYKSRQLNLRRSISFSLINI